MMYCIGSDLESSGSYATKNLIQAMRADYNEDLNFIVLTGETSKWSLSSEYLIGAAYEYGDINNYDLFDLGNLVSARGGDGCNDKILLDIYWTNRAIIIENI